MSLARPNSNSARALGVLVLALVALSGCQGIMCLADPNEETICEERLDVLDEDLSVSRPVPFGLGVAYRVEAADQVVILHTSSNTAAIQHISVPESPSLLRATDNGDRLVVMSSVAQTLTVIDPGPGKVLRTFKLGSPFDSLSLSDDGLFAIAYYGADASGAIVRNVNEMAIIRLEDPPDETNPQLITLRSFGTQRLSVTFAPPFTVYDDAERRFALILSENSVTLLELDGFDPADPNANETVVRFVQDSDTRSVRPQQVVWTPDDPNDPLDMFAFIRARGSDDIISLNLVPSEELDSLDRPRIRPSLNQLSGGRAPSSFGMFKDTRGRNKLISVNTGTQDIAIIDVDTSDATLIPLDVPVTEVLLFDAVNPDTDVQQPYALLYGYGSLRTVLFVDLATAEVRRGRAVKALSLGQPIERLDLTPDGVKALILHPGRAAFSILNLERRSVSPLEVASPISDYDFVNASGNDQLISVFQSLPYISLTELTTAHSSPVELDMAAKTATVIQRTNTIVVGHSVKSGAVTLIPLSDPRRESANTLWGFGADELLEIRD